jgi:isopentenyl phosphate kinase
MTGELIVLKWGGGLITHKSDECSPDLESIAELSKVVNTLISEGNELILVHGAGSYGHIKAKKSRLSEGDIGLIGQLEAVAEVRKDMLELNRLVMKDLDGEAYPPHLWATETGPGFNGKLPLNPPLTIVFGDVVDCANNSWGILSGDDLVLRYAIECNAARVVFAIRGVDGLLTAPPDEGGELIEEIHGRADYRGSHSEGIDVTGGISLKVIRAEKIALSGIEVYFVNGENMNSVYNACSGKTATGTKFFSRNA